LLTADGSIAFVFNDGENPAELELELKLLRLFSRDRVVTFSSKDSVLTGAARMEDTSFELVICVCSSSDVTGVAECFAQLPSADKVLAIQSHELPAGIHTLIYDDLIRLDQIDQKQFDRDLVRVVNWTPPVFNPPPSRKAH